MVGSIDLQSMCSLSPLATLPVNIFQQNVDSSSFVAIRLRRAFCAILVVILRLLVLITIPMERHSKPAGGGNTYFCRTQKKLNM